MRKLNRFKEKLFSTPTLFVIVLSLILIVYIMVNFSINTNIKNEEKIISTFDEIEEQINTVIYKSIKRESKEKVKTVSDKLRKELVSLYEGNEEQFIRDYDNAFDESIFIKTLNRALEEEDDRFFHVRNDNNDIYIISPKEILADKSVVKSSKDGIDRTLENEIHNYPNEDMAKEVYDKILDGYKGDLFLQTEEHENVIKDLDYRKVLKLPMEDLKNYRFISVSYIDEYGDLIGTKDVDYKGKKQNSRKIILIQSFNLYDQIFDLGLNNNYNVIRSQKEMLLEGQTFEREIYSVTGILLVVVFISCFLVMAFFKNQYIRERDKNGD